MVTEEMKIAGFRAYNEVMQGFEPTGLDAAEACFKAMLISAFTDSQWWKLVAKQHDNKTSV